MTARGSTTISLQLELEPGDRVSGSARLIGNQLTGENEVHFFGWTELMVAVDELRARSGTTIPVHTSSSRIHGQAEKAR